MDQSDEVVDLDKVKQVISIDCQNSYFAFENCNDNHHHRFFSKDKLVQFDVKTTCIWFWKMVLKMSIIGSSTLLGDDNSKESPIQGTYISWLS